MAAQFSMSGDAIGGAGASARAPEPAHGRRDPDFYIVDEKLRVLDSPAGRHPAPDGLRPHIRAVVSRLLLRNPGVSTSLVEAVGDDEVVRVIPLSGNMPCRFAIFVEPQDRHDRLSSAAHRFGLTVRETEIVAALIRGEPTTEIAADLHISVYTVQQHITNIGRKLDCTKRSEIVAAVLGTRTRRGLSAR